MGNMFIEKLHGLNDMMTSEYEKTDCPIQTCDLLKKELYAYSEIISSFFIGKEEDIKNIYKLIRNNERPYNKITCSDVNIAISNYSSYFDGLYHFVSTVCGLLDTDTQVSENILGTTDKVSEKDNDFVASLFVNKETFNLDQAMQNVEALVDVYKNLDSYIICVVTLSNKIKENNCEKYKNEISVAYKVLVKSIRGYIANLISEILSTYSSIEESIKTRESVKGTPVAPEYQIF